MDTYRYVTILAVPQTSISLTKSLTDTHLVPAASVMGTPGPDGGNRKAMELDSDTGNIK